MYIPKENVSFYSKRAFLLVFVKIGVIGKNKKNTNRNEHIKDMVSRKYIKKYTLQFKHFDKYTGMDI